MTPAVPTSDQNPKSILADKNTTEKSNEHSSLRVTFAKTPANKSPAANKNDVSSPVTKPLSAGQKKGKKMESKAAIPPEKQVTPPSTTIASRNASSTSKFGTTTLSTFYRTLKEDANTRGAKKLPELVLEKSKHVKGGPSATVFTRHKSSESLGHSSKRSTLTTSSRRGVKTKKYLRSTPRLSRNTSRTPTSMPRRSKSGKRLKKRVKSGTSTSKSKDSDLNAFKPAKLNEEYAKELNNITQILRAVSNFDATTGTGSGVIDTARERVKVTTIVQGKRSNTTTTDAVHRPLSADELKQLLSSITRVVSLHQLPVSGPTNNTGGVGQVPKSPTKLTPPTTATENLSSIKESNSLSSTNASKNKTATNDTTEAGSSKKRKGRKGKESSSGGGDEERSRGNKPTNKTRSKSSIRKGRSKSKVKDSLPRRTSSVSSTETNPVQNAAFLRKYFEESVRLATKKSSEEINLVNTEEGDKKKKRRTKIRAPRKGSSKSITQREKSLQSILTTNGAVKPAKSVSKTKTVDNKPKQPVPKVSTPAIRDFLKKEQPSERPKSKGPSDNKKDTRKPFKVSTNVSTTAVAGSYKQLPVAKRGTSETKVKGRKLSKVRSKSQGPLEIKPLAGSESVATSGGVTGAVASEGALSTNKSEHTNDMVDSFVTRITNESANFNKFRPLPQTPVKFQITDPMKNNFAATPIPNSKSQKQFDTVQEVINSKYAPDTTKMKSIWDKTPYQPMTHERFKELVSNYTHVDVLNGFKEEKKEAKKTTRQRTPTEKKSRENITGKKYEKVAAADEQRKPGTSGGGAVSTPTPPRSAPRTPILPYVRTPNPEKLLILPKPWEFGPESTVPVRHEPTVQQLQPPPATISKWIGSDAGSTYNRLNYDYNEERLSIMRQAHRARQRLREETAHRRKSVTKGPIGGPLVEEPPKEEYDPMAFYRNLAKRNAKTY
ncbi:unnamed protein product [Orchesella dallaii]|uniref:Uncharacterized protein n=1 Tax=Orchesella dallaii TaxID=48710 RepID=A0ABP1QT33_9HEXA